MRPIDGDALCDLFLQISQAMPTSADESFVRNLMETIERAPTLTAAEAMPVHIGDEVWCIRNFRGRHIPKCGEVSEIYMLRYNPEGLGVAVRNVGRGIWGFDVFPTAEEAQAVIDSWAGQQ